MASSKGRRKGRASKLKKIQQKRRKFAISNRNRRAGNDSDSSDEEGAFHDDVSFISEGGSFFSDVGDAGKDDDDTPLPEDVFEDKLSELMELATQKAASARVTALKNLCRRLMQRLVPDYLEERRLTLTELCDKALKKGKEDKQRAASILAALICVQLGLADSAEAVFTELRPALETQMALPTGTQKSRAAMATTLGILAFLQCPVEETDAVMRSLEKVFSVHASGAELQTGALNSWTLLATIMPAYKAADALRSPLSKYLQTAMDSPDVDLRIAAGEAVGVLHEVAKDAAATPEAITEKIAELSTDSNKYRSKKDRKEQRSTFRNLVKSMDGEEAVYLVKIVKTGESVERLVIDSWCLKKQYDSFRKVLAMDVFLQKSEVIRDIFGMGPPIAIDDAKENKPTKQAKQMMFKQKEKVRKQHRAKQRSSGGPTRGDF